MRHSPIPAPCVLHKLGGCDGITLGGVYEYLKSSHHMNLPRGMCSWVSEYTEALDTIWNHVLKAMKLSDDSSEPCDVSFMIPYRSELHGPNSMHENSTLQCLYGDARGQVLDPPFLTAASYYIFSKFI